jgi:hypothetical protein
MRRRGINAKLMLVLLAARWSGLTARGLWVSSTLLWIGPHAIARASIYGS